jgi:small-conductance mechanosensitive channel
MEPWLKDVLSIGSGAIFGSVLAYTLLMLLARYVIPDRILSPLFIQKILRTIRFPIAAIVLLIAAGVVLPLIDLSEELTVMLRQLVSVLQISAVGWFGIACTVLMCEFFINAYDVSVSDNLKARKMHTKINVIQQIVTVLIIFIAVAAILMSFDKVRQLGVSLLASAGVFGIIIGFAAQKSIATLLAGIQIAITQPIRVDDVVIVENEWGWIEEITLTYVVVKIWDLRRLVLPIDYFLNSPFQNWTRVSADILGTVFIYADYTVPFDELRAELKRVCEGSDLWDKKVCGLQVTDATKETVQIRALVSAKDSPKAWDLRCLVRERLIDYLQKNYPASLPRTRVALESNASGETSATAADSPLV